ncbi:MAG TPA: hypothetical protein VNW49_09330 [Puia sp.]|nr:hypothetical protein [Puia sp.]
MIPEVAVFNVIPEKRAGFEGAFGSAQEIISTSSFQFAFPIAEHYYDWYIKMIN